MRNEPSLGDDSELGRASRKIYNKAIRILAQHSYQYLMDPWSYYQAADTRSWSNQEGDAEDGGTGHVQQEGSYAFADPSAYPYHVQQGQWPTHQSWQSVVMRTSPSSQGPESYYEWNTGSQPGHANMNSGNRPYWLVSGSGGHMTQPGHLDLWDQMDWDRPRGGAVTPRADQQYHQYTTAGQSGPSVPSGAAPSGE